MRLAADTFKVKCTCTDPPSVRKRTELSIEVSTPPDRFPPESVTLMLKKAMPLTPVFCVAFNAPLLCSVGTPDRMSCPDTLRTLKV